jgi:hypothetical protein
MAGAMRYNTRYSGEPESRGVDGTGSPGLYFAVENRIFLGGSIEGDGYLVVKAGVNLLRKKSSGRSSPFAHPGRHTLCTYLPN